MCDGYLWLKLAAYFPPEFAQLLKYGNMDKATCKFMLTKAVVCQTCVSAKDTGSNKSQSRRQSFKTQNMYSAVKGFGTNNVWASLRDSPMLASQKKSACKTGRAPGRDYSSGTSRGS